MKLFEADIGALLMRVWQASPSTGEITPANLLVAGTAIAVVVAGMVSAIVLAVVNNWLSKAKAERQEEVNETENFGDLIKAVVTLGKGMSDSSATAAQDRLDASDERKRLLGLMDNAETKKDAKDGRDSAVAAINQHTDDSQTKINLHTTEQVDLLRKDVTKLQTAADDAVAGIKKAVTADQLIKALEPLQAQLDNISRNAGDILRQKPITPAPIDAHNGSAEPQPTPEANP